MNDKTTLQELIEVLAQRHQMEPADAEIFVKTVLSLIEEALASDKYVKIKGLGTFKLIEIEERESVDVNTGERIRIQSHFRISFIPDPVLRDLVNKPFAHFETVVLNDNTHFDDLEENGTDENEDMEQDGEDEESMTDRGQAPEDSIVKEEKKEEVELPVEVCEDKKNDIGLSEKTGTTPSCNVVQNEEPKKNSRFPWCMIASVLLAGVMLGGGIIWGLLSGRRYIPESVISCLMEKKATENVASPHGIDSLKLVSVPLNKDTVQTACKSEMLKDTVLTDLQKPNTVKPSASSAVSLTAKKTVPQTKPEMLSDTTDYTISGTKFLYTIEEGETLVRIALKFYGNKKLWPYLVKHNKDVIKDANNVPAGLIIKIPVLIPEK